MRSSFAKKDVRKKNKSREELLMRINNNLMAMNTHRQLGMNQAGGAKSLEKLSSGLRINRAGDDAAGLAISEKMRGQIRGLNQATRNAQDGISLIQTAEGALQETHSILQRMRELGVQAGTDVVTDSDRQNIQSEIDQLTNEISRISNTTEFNQNNLLAGGFNDRSILIGANQGQNVSFSIGMMDAKSLGVTSDVITTNIANDTAGISAAVLRDGTGAAQYAGQTIGITSTLLQADSAGQLQGSSAAQTINDAQAANAVATAAFGAGADATSASINAYKEMNTAATYATGAIDASSNGTLTAASQATYVTGAIDASLLKAATEGTYETGAIDASALTATGTQTFTFTTDGGTTDFDIVLTEGDAAAVLGGTADWTITADRGADGTTLASALQTELRTETGDASLTVEYDTDTNTMLFTTGATGSDQSIALTVVADSGDVGETGFVGGTPNVGTDGTTNGSVTFNFTMAGVNETAGVAQPFDIVLSAAETDSLTDEDGLAALLQTKLSGYVGESVAVANNSGVLTFTTGATGSDQSIVLNSVEDSGSVAQASFTNGDGATAGTTGTTTLNFTMKGVNSDLAFDITLTEGVDWNQTSDQDASNGSLAAALSTKLSAIAGQTITANYDSTTDAMTFQTAEKGSDQSIVLNTVTNEAAAPAAGFTDGVAATVGTGTGSVDGTGFGKVSMSIDDTAFNVTINESSTLANVLDNINSAANTALGTTGVTYASEDTGNIVITSNTDSTGSTVKILGDFESDGTTSANGALLQNLGLSLSATSQTGMSDVGASGTAGTFSLTVNGTSFDVTLANGNTIADVTTAINAAAETAGVIDNGDELAINNGTIITLTTTDVKAGAGTGSNANIIIGEDENAGKTLAAIGLTSGIYKGADATSGSLRISVDGTEFSVGLIDGSDATAIANAINASANTALGTSSQNYASVSQGRVVIESLTSGSNSSVGILNDNTSGRTIEALGLQVGTVSGANTGQLQVVASVGGASESVAIDTNADIIKFSQAFAGLTLTKDGGHNTAGTADIATSVLKSESATMTTDGRIKSEASVQKGILVDTADAANKAVSAINDAITSVSDQRSALGALQNRLEHTISNLGASAENLQAAESRVRDVDMAAEMMQFTKNNILQQAATAMLAQANQAPQGVLQLLR